MPKNKVSDPITDQEMAFARLVLSGAMTDRHAAETAGLNPDSAAYTKSKPHVRAYMHEHRAAVEEKLVQQEADGVHRLNLDREQVLARLWEIANLSPEMTRGSITGQVKALSMILAMQNFIPDRLAVSEKKSPTAPAQPQIYASTPAQQEDSPACPGLPRDPGASRSTFGDRLSPSQAPPPAPYVPLFASVPDMGVGFPIKKNPLNPFVHPR